MTAFSKPGRVKRRYYPNLGSTTNPGEPELNTTREQERRLRQLTHNAGKAYLRAWSELAQAKEKNW